jgi:hypothetical protein
MTADVLIYIGTGIITLWGITHIVPTKSVVDGFGELSTNNRRIITMERIAEGLTSALSVCSCSSSRFSETLEILFPSSCIVLAPSCSWSWPD